MGRLGGEVGDERAGLVVPAENGDALAQPVDQAWVSEDTIDGGAPGEHEHEHDHIGDDHEPARDRRLKFKDERQAQVGGKPEGGALDDETESLKLSQQQALFVEVELGKGDDQKTGADQEQGQVGGVAGVGHIQTDTADRRGVTQPVAEGQSGKGHEGVSDHEEGGEDDFAKTGGFGHEGEQSLGVGLLFSLFPENRASPVR